MELEPITLCLLAIVAFIAGGIDAVAGGGGLLTVPALLMTGMDPRFALGTNKAQAVWGAVAALWRYSRSPLLDRRRARVGFVMGFVGSGCGALLVQVVPSNVLGPLIVALLVFAAFTVLFVRPSTRGERLRPLWHWFVVAFVIGSYDGFFGPGTGTFLIIAGVLWWGRTYDAASADAKAVNCASNLGGLIIFTVLGQVLWLPALVMAGACMLGGWCGAHLVIKRGQGLVRAVAVTMSLSLAVKLLTDMWR